MATMDEWEAAAESEPPPIEATFTEIVEDGDERLTGLLCELGKASGYNYTSDSPDEDFSIAIELMLETGIYLKIFGDLVRRFGVLSQSQEKEFREHVEKVEEFTGQWGS